MLDTVNTKPDQMRNGYFSIGTGPIKVLILGSCRVVPYVNYLVRLNNHNHFTINLVNVVHFCFDDSGNSIDGSKTVEKLESNHGVLDMIKGNQWFIHEHTENFGMFNTSDLCEKNIYQFGMNAQHDIAIPNFHNLFILFQDILDWNKDIRNMAALDMKTCGRLSEATKDKVTSIGREQLSRFIGFCIKSDLPEFAPIFDSTWQKTRYFWTINHISAAFTITLFRLMNDLFLNWNVTDDFWKAVENEDLYTTPCAPITQYDRECYSITWPQRTMALNLD